MMDICKQSHIFWTFSYCILFKYLLFAQGVKARGRDGLDRWVVLRQRPFRLIVWNKR